MAAARSIAVVTPRHVPGGTVGGAETLLRELALRLAARGDDVHVLTTCAHDHFTWANEIPAGERRDGPLRVHHFPVDAGRDAALYLDRQRAICGRGEVTRADEETWLAHSVHSTPLYDHLRAGGGRYDRVLAGPYLFGVVYRAALIRPERTLLVPCLHDEPFARLSIMRDLFQGVRGLLFNSEPEMELAGRLYGLDARRCAVVGMGIDPFEADPGAFARRHGITTPYALYCGRREAAKGTPLLVEYLHVFRERNLKDIALVVTGSGPVDARPFVRDFGMVDEAEKREAMAGARVFIHPSTFESLGIVLLESFMARTPAMVHSAGEVLRWQCRRSGAGLWFRHYPDFEDLLLRLLADEPLRRRMGEQGRRYVETEYAWPAVEARLLRALAEI